MKNRKPTTPPFPRSPVLALAGVSLALGLPKAVYAAPTQGSLGPPPSPPENPISRSKANLGRALFWDEQLSTLDTMACATCHLPEAAGADPRTMEDLPGSTYIGWDRTFGTEDDTHSSPGIAGHGPDLGLTFRKQTEMGPQLTIRNTPMVFDSAYVPDLLVDGRAEGRFVDPSTGTIVSAAGAALESQAAIAYSDEKEMGFFGRPAADVVLDVENSSPLALATAVPPDFAAWLGTRSYPELFAEAFGTPEVSIVRIAQAVATYERTLVTFDQIPFDAFLDGDTSALTDPERRGHGLFVSKGCADCHPGAIMSDHGYHNLGLDDLYDDVGREFVTGLPGDHGKFRTPTLRNLELTAPYFHDGSALTIEDAIDFFDRGGHYSSPNKDPRIVPLAMTSAEKQDLATFLRRPLTDPRAAQLVGPYERIGLYAESPVAPELYGTATAGSDGEPPRMFAPEPTRLGATINVAISRAAPGAPAALLVSTVPDLFGSDFQGAHLHLAIVPGTSATRVQVAPPGFGEGSRSLRVTLPGAPSLAGTNLFAQWLVFDPRPSGRLAATEAVRMLLFQ